MLLTHLESCTRVEPVHGIGAAAPPVVQGLVELTYAALLTLEPVVLVLLPTHMEEC